MSEQEPGTPGGARLRSLREKQALTQLHVEFEAELGTGYLQRLESGRVKQPVRATLERILDALGARFTERRDILEVFGYTVRANLPTPEERAWADSVASGDLSRFPFPAYVLDCIPWLVAWNQSFPRLLGPGGERLVREELTGRSFLGAWFDPASPLSGMVLEPDRFLPALIRTFRHEIRPYQNEPWYPELMAELRWIDRFRHYWDVVEQEPPPVSAVRALVPVRLRVPGAGEVQFRLSAEPFTRDSRFRIVYYFPSDARTIEICQSWADERSTGPVAPGTRSDSG